MAATEVDKSPQRVRRMFGQIAPRYDLLNHLLSLQLDRWWRRRAAKLVRPEPGLPILDVCTGTGDLALAFRRRQPEAPVVGVDFCREMLRLARRKRDQAAQGEEAVLFVEGDAQQLPLADNQFQIVAVAFGLRNVADTDRGLHEMVRVCRPGGRVAVLEFSMPGWGPARAAYGWYFRRVLPRVGQWLARNDQNAYHYLPASVGQFPAGDALLARMEAAGLASLRRHAFTLGVATLYVGEKPGRTTPRAREPAAGACGAGPRNQVGTHA